jgi:hypothetical protein
MFVAAKSSEKNSSGMPIGHTSTWQKEKSTEQDEE